MTAVAGVGIDVLEVERLAAALTRWGDRLLYRLFTDAELFRARPGRARAERLAARFAAKEAVMKALGEGWRAIAWREIEIRTDPSGKPMVVLHGDAERLAHRLGVTGILISLTHTPVLAMATAIAITSGPASGPPPPKAARTADDLGD